MRALLLLALASAASAGEREEHMIESLEAAFGKQGDFKVSPLPKRLHNSFNELVEKKGSADAEQITKFLDELLSQTQRSTPKTVFFDSMHLKSKSAMSSRYRTLSKMFHPHGDLARIDPDTFQKVWEKLDDAKGAAEMDVNMKALVEGTEVVAINDANADDYLSSGFTLIDFYAPWCGHCQTFAPLFAEAAAELKARSDGTEKVVLATTDGTATESMKLHDTMRVKEYPAMRWVVDGEWMELTPDMMVHNKRSVIKWVEKHTAHYRSTGVKFENALDWVTQTRYGKSASEISTALGLGGSATSLRKLAFEDFVLLAKEKDLASLKLQKGKMLDKRRWKRAVQSLDTMAAGPADQESEAQPAPPAGESATSSAADGNKKEKVSIDMDEL